jgi:hypothetical protein
MNLPNTDENLYGLRFDAHSGRLTMDIINGDSLASPSDYNVSFWSRLFIQFTFLTNGHLQAKML